MKLSIIKAMKGDSFILEWGDRDQYSMLLDGGYPSTYNEGIKKIVSNLKNLKAVVVSHVDYDHIYGIIKMLDDESVKNDFILYLNTPELIINKNKNSKVGYKEGELLIKLIEEKKIRHESIFLPNTQNFKIEGLEFTVLSPTKEVLELLKLEWDAYRIDKAEKEKNKLSGLVSAKSKKLTDVNEILKSKESVKNWKNDLVNSSSITFIVEYNKKKILFLADGNPDLIEYRLRELGYTEEVPLIVNALKVSHHGCKHNTTKSLLKIIKTDKVIISTNQRGNSRHPHRETIIKIANYLQRSKKDLEFMFNYKVNYEEFITLKEREDYNLKFDIKNLIEF